MKTKDIAYGGLMIATFLVLSFIFRGSARVVQTYLEIVKTIVIAVFLRKIDGNSWWVMALACFASCLLIISIPDTLIYNVPSIVCGCVIGLQKNNSPKLKSYLSFFAVHTIMMIYEIVIFGLVMKTNLFILYGDQFSDTLEIITNGEVNKSFLGVLFILFTIFDSAFSSLIIFAFAQVVLRKLEK